MTRNMETSAGQRKRRAVGGRRQVTQRDYLTWHLILITSGTNNTGKHKAAPDGSEWLLHTNIAASFPRAPRASTMYDPRLHTIRLPATTRLEPVVEETRSTSTTSDPFDDIQPVRRRPTSSTTSDPRRRHLIYNDLTRHPAHIDDTHPTSTIHNLRRRHPTLAKIHQRRRRYLVLTEPRLYTHRRYLSLVEEKPDAHK